MRKSLVLLFCLTLLGCSSYAHNQFYVKSQDKGYVVAVGVNTGDIAISRPFSQPKEAQELAEKLNKDIGDDWNYREK